MTATKILEENEDLRSASFQHYMPFDSLLFFGREGNGDLYAYPIKANGSFAANIFERDHENDSRFWIANNLRDLLCRIASDIED